MHKVFIGMIKTWRKSIFGAKILVLFIALSFITTAKAAINLGNIQIVNYQPHSRDVVLEDDSQEAYDLLASGPTIDIWYGLNQSFGQLGKPQGQINVVGNVSDDNGITSLTYSLNSGPQIPLSIGLDTRRLLNQGDFNVELFDNDPALLTGVNQLIITATNGLSDTSSETVILNYTRGNTWPLPYSIDWDSATSITDVAQIVDGKWEKSSAGVRTLDPGYDRLIAIGDVAWDDYQISVPITIHSNLTSSAILGFLLRWNGHTDHPIPGWQPKSGWVPFGAMGRYAWKSGYIGDRLQIFGNPNVSLAEDFGGRKLAEDIPYIFKMRVESIPTQGPVYALKVWQADTSEPAEWDLVGQGDVDDPANGSILLLAHLVDATFGDVTIEPIGVDNISPSISNIQIKAGLTSAIITWDTDEPTSGSVAYGPSVAYEYGSAADPDMGETHSVLLTGLTPSNRYHFQIQSGDTQGNSTLSGDQIIDTSSPAASPGILSDDFNTCSLDEETWSFIDPVGDAASGTSGSFTQDAWLSMTLPEGSDHDIWIDKYNAPRVMQPASNANFEIEVKFESGLSSRNQTQGILIEESETNQDFLRFELVNDGSGTKVNATVFMEGFPSVKYEGSVGAAGISPIFMRVTRQGDDWSLRYSLDGTFGNPSVTFTHPLNVSAVGAYAGNSNLASHPPVPNIFLAEEFSLRDDGITPLSSESLQAAPAFTGHIDYFKETSALIVPEDGERNDIALTIQPPGGGSVAIEPDKTAYTCGESVTITANPQPGWIFSAWSGDLSGSSNPVDLQMTGSREITASFLQEGYTLDVDIVGTGSVAKSPDQLTYDPGELVQLMATPGASWDFSGWGGDLSGDTNPIEVAMTADKHITATFSPKPYALYLKIQGDGYVLKVPEQEVYIYGDVVMLTAIADPGWSFNGWSGDLTGSSNPTNILMDEGKTIVANFIKEQFRKLFIPIILDSE